MVQVKSKPDDILSEGVVSVDEACEFLSVGRTSIYDLMDKQVIPWTKVGGRRRIPRKALRDYLMSGMRGL